MTISLTGFMGSGKSSVGRKLSALLSLPGEPVGFIDLDDFIVESEGMSVNEIFEKKGESGFRAIETQCLETVLERYEGRLLVLALGGGTAVFNPELVHSRTRCIYLSASVDTLVSRLASDTSRPLLSGLSAETTGNDGLEKQEELRNRIERLYRAREATYLSVAHHVIATDGLSVADVAARIAGMSFESSD